MGMPISVKNAAMAIPKDKRFKWTMSHLIYGRQGFALDPAKVNKEWGDAGLPSPLYGGSGGSPAPTPQQKTLGTSGGSTSSSGTSTKRRRTVLSGVSTGSGQSSILGRST